MSTRAVPKGLPRGGALLLTAKVSPRSEFRTRVPAALSARAGAPAASSLSPQAGRSLVRPCATCAYLARTKMRLSW